MIMLTAILASPQGAYAQTKFIAYDLEINAVGRAALKALKGRAPKTMDAWTRREDLEDDVARAVWQDAKGLLLSIREA